MSGGAPLVFVGGTGRSGTHVVAELLGEHSRFADVPVEARFHCNPKGLADLVRGEVSAQEFLAKLRRFWWHRVRVGERATVRLGRLAGRRLPQRGKVRGLHTIASRERFEEALARFEASCTADLVQASRGLFFDLLGPIAEEEGKPGLVEMSCFTIAAAPELARIFPEARFVHVVRDGRDAGSSKVSKREKRHHPTDVLGGIDWWQERLRLAEEGVRGLDDAGARLHVVALDELVWSEREGAYAGLLDFLGVGDEAGPRDFFERRMTPAAAHRERWSEGLDEAERAQVERRYSAALARIEHEGYHCAGVLRRVYERGLVGV